MMSEPFANEDVQTLEPVHEDEGERSTLKAVAQFTIAPCSRCRLIS